MTDKNNGGSAYPQNTVYVAPNGQVQAQGPQGGMTLRDYFAAKALPLSAARFANGHENGWVGIAQHAYNIADAMLKARD